MAFGDEVWAGELLSPPHVQDRLQAAVEVSLGVAVMAKLNVLERSIHGPTARHV
jgi:hypothetical protein